MTREEAARILNPDTYSEESAKITDEIVWSFMVDEACRMGAEALMAAREPDPKTGLMACECGGKAEVGRTLQIYGFDRKWEWFVECRDCGYRSGYGWTQKEAVSEWNYEMNGEKEP